MQAGIGGSVKFCDFFWRGQSVGMEPASHLL